MISLSYNKFPFDDNLDVYIYIYITGLFSSICAVYITENKSHNAMWLKVELWFAPSIILNSHFHRYQIKS